MPVSKHSRRSLRAADRLSLGTILCDKISHSQDPAPGKVAATSNFPFGELTTRPENRTLPRIERRATMDERRSERRALLATTATWPWWFYSCRPSAFGSYSSQRATGSSTSQIRSVTPSAIAELAHSVRRILMKLYAKEFTRIAAPWLRTLPGAPDPSVRTWDIYIPPPFSDAIRNASTPAPSTVRNSSLPCRANQERRFSSFTRVAW